MLRIGDGAGSAFDVGLKPVQHGVDLADGEVAPIHFLAEIAGGECNVPVLSEIVGGVNQHTAGAASGIVDGVARPHLSSGVVGELLDEVLVGPTKHVRRNTLV